MATLLIKLEPHCSPALTPTVYAVLQQFGAQLLPLLGQSDQSQRSAEGQLAQESVGGHNMLRNLKKRERQKNVKVPFFLFLF